MVTLVRLKLHLVATTILLLIEYIMFIPVFYESVKQFRYFLKKIFNKNPAYRGGE